MAKLLGLSLRGYQNYERGEREIPLPALDDAHERVGLNPDWVRDGAGEMFDRGRQTVPAGDFFTESEGTATDARLSESQPKDQNARMAASQPANAVLKQAGVDAGVGLRAAIRDLALWYGVPEVALAELAAAVREDRDRALRNAAERDD